MQKRLTSMLVVILITCLCSQNVLVAAELLCTTNPGIAAKGAALMDVASGRLLVGVNENMQLPMASTTKIMTAILAIESGKLADLVTVSQAAVMVEPSSIWLVAGEKIMMRHLLYGLMLRSGNDAACAIAEHLAGSLADFNVMMNDKAKAIGLENTQFQNPHGLPAADHYTTAHDLAKLTSYALRNKQFSATVATTRFTFMSEQAGLRTWYNKNKLLQQYDGADGVKTGWTRAAGRCLVASANRNGQRLVAVVLNSPADFNETAALLDYGFTNFKTVSVIAPGQYMQTVPIAKGYPASVGAIVAEEFLWTVRHGEVAQLEYFVKLEPDLKAPLAAGSLIGSLQINHAGSLVANIPLITDQICHRGRLHLLLGAFYGNFKQMLLRTSGRRGGDDELSLVVNGLDRYHSGCCFWKH